MRPISKPSPLGVTYFVVQAFSAVKGRRGAISADVPLPASDHAHALRMVERLKSTRAGVVAFRRTGTPETGDWDDAVIIARHGVLPGDIEALADESDGAPVAA